MVAGCAWWEGHVWQGGMHGRVCVVGGMCGKGACVVTGMQRGMHSGGGVVGGHPWHERQPLQRKVRILLECILVIIATRGCDDESGVLTLFILFADHR